MTDEQFVELFKITYTGNVGDLRTNIEDIDGVDSASHSKHPYMDVDTTLDFDLAYDSHLTDRTSLANEIEDIDGVEDVIFG